MDKEPIEQEVSTADIEAARAVIANFFGHPEDIGVESGSAEFAVTDSPEGLQLIDKPQRGGTIKVDRNGAYLEARRAWHYDDTLLEPKWVEVASIIADGGEKMAARAQINIANGKLMAVAYRDANDDTMSIRGDKPTKEGLEMALLVVDMTKQALQKQPE